MWGGRRAREESRSQLHRPQLPQSNRKPAKASERRVPGSELRFRIGSPSAGWMGGRGGQTGAEASEDANGEMQTEAQGRSREQSRSSEQAHRLSRSRELGS